MTPVTLLHEAEIELWEAVAYYEEKASGLGLDFANEVERCLKVVSEAPARWSLRPDGTRRFLTQRFPYLIVYTIEDDHVWVIAIAHCKRRTGYWNERT
jgi:plasmid stabilization system protein ParE